MDFYKIRVRDVKGVLQAYPDWIVGSQVKDLMLRGGDFYAVWDEERGLWSTEEFDVQRLVDRDLRKFVEENGGNIIPMTCGNFGNGTWEKFNKYIRSLPDNANYHPLDNHVVFADTPVEKRDYVSKRLSYPLKEGRTDAWDELLGVLYAPEERDKIEWCIGSIVSGDSKWIQKFFVFYGPPGSGKSTIIGVIEKLFEQYVATFEAKALTSNNNNFAMESFAGNPLLAIQHDGDLSRIEDNTRLNSIVGHDLMTINAKFRSPFSIRPNAMVVLGTNKPVKISDSRAGNTRRLVDVTPTGVKIEPSRYHILMERINYELGGIAWKCLHRYREMGKFYYDTYIPTAMMQMTDHFYNFVESHFDIFKAEDALQAKRIWEMYKQYCDDSNIIKRLQYHELRTEISNYFEHFKDRYFVGEKEYRSVYVGFKGLPTNRAVTYAPDTSYNIELEDYDPDSFDSAFNRLCADQPAQEAKEDATPARRWENVQTKLRELDTRRTHFVKVPTQHIVLDFDLKDDEGNKDLQKNIEEASKFPPTYTELSHSGNGVHLHYIYDGDVTQLKSVYSDGIEIKTLLGDSSLRRRLSKCNNIDVMPLSGGLPQKEKAVLDTKQVQSEKGLREHIERNLRKESHPGTKPSIDFIHKILEDAYNSGLSYNVSDMRPRILSFAANSTNNADYCIKKIQTMQFVGQKEMKEAAPEENAPLVFFDVEVYPNLFVLCWKYADSPNVVRMVNPSGQEVGDLFKYKLVGFNNRRYDNHILYARYLGWSVEELFRLSQKMVNNDRKNNTAQFGEAYNLSYADIFDLSTKKQGLKKFQIELGLHHQELDIPWDQPVPDEMWDKVVEYCVNDVITTEAVFEDRKQDFVARSILAELSGLPINHTTQQHTARIIFGEDKDPQSKFVYTDLRERFPGYKFDGKESWYCDEIVGEGGYVYAEPGYYENVTELDITSMHPTSIVELNLFGDYTQRFKELLDARIAIKRKNYAAASDMFGGRLKNFLTDTEGAEDLAYALKIAINIVYGLTSASFPNPFRDSRNKDNIVAKRGALFMIDLKNEVMAQGWTACHIKTDSIKIPNAEPNIIEHIIQLGREYGYEFEVSATYDKFCLVNDAVYIARSGDRWTAVGTQFQHPFVFKDLFSKEEITFDDLCEVRNVTKGVMFLAPSGVETVENMRFVGRTGSFMPVNNGGVLWRVNDDKMYHVAGTKGYLWVEREVALHRQQLDELETDMSYFMKLREDALNAIEQFVPYQEFIS